MMQRAECEFSPTIPNKGDSKKASVSRVDTIEPPEVVKVD
jgi:hypothetical protein